MLLSSIRIKLQRLRSPLLGPHRRIQALHGSINYLAQAVFEFLLVYDLTVSDCVAHGERGLHKDSAASFLSSPDRPPSSFSIPVTRAGTKEIPCSSLDKKSIAISPFVFCDLNSRAEPPVVKLFPPAIM